MFLSPITDQLLSAKVAEGEAVEVMSLEKAMDLSDFKPAKTLLTELRKYLYES